MLKHTSHSRDEIVGHMRPTNFREFWEYTVEKVAVNAVMAGARPEYFPVILAMAATGVSARGSTHQLGGGDVRRERPDPPRARDERGIGAMGPYNHANATIGRAWGLLSTNLQGGSTPGPDLPRARRATTTPTPASPSPRTRSGAPGTPFHVQHGFKANDSTVSLFGGCRATAFTLGLREKYWQKHVRNLLRGLDPHTRRSFVLDPITAQQFVDRGGFDTKEKLIEWIHQNATHGRRRSTGTTS